MDSGTRERESDPEATPKNDRLFILMALSFPVGNNSKALRLGSPEIMAHTHKKKEMQM